MARCMCVVLSQEVRRKGGVKRHVTHARRGRNNLVCIELKEKK